MKSQILIAALLGLAVLSRAQNNEEEGLVVTVEENGETIQQVTNVEEAVITEAALPDEAEPAVLDTENAEVVTVDEDEGVLVAPNGETEVVDVNEEDTTAPDTTTAPVDTAPVDTAPVDTAPVDTAPVDTAPVDTAPVDTAPVDTAPVDTAPVDTAPVDTTTVVPVVPVVPVDTTTVPPVDTTTVPPVDTTTVPPVDTTAVPPVDTTTPAAPTLAAIGGAIIPVDGVTTGDVLNNGDNAATAAPGTDSTDAVIGDEVDGQGGDIDSSNDGTDNGTDSAIDTLTNDVNANAGNLVSGDGADGTAAVNNAPALSGKIYSVGFSLIVSSVLAYLTA